MGFSLGLAGAIGFTYLLAIRRRFAALTDAALGALVLAVAQVIVTARLLSLLGLLRLLPLLLLNLVLLSGVLWAGRRGLAAAWRSTWRRVGGFFRLLGRSPLCLGLALALIALLAWVLWQAAVLPEASYDGLAYHLPMAFSRIQFADARAIPGWPLWLSSYPEHSELLMAWIVLLDGSAALVDAVQWAFWPAAFLACYGLARKLGVPAMPSFAGGALLAFAPAVALQAGVAYNDLIIAALLLAALNLLVARGLLSTLLAGTALGIIAGVKYAGVLFPLVGGLALLLIDPPWRPGQTFWRRALALALPVLLLGAPWYIANWVRTGNPLWPYIVWLGDRQLFHGLTSARAIYLYALDPQYRGMPGALLAPTFWLEPTSSYSYEARYSGLGLLWPVLGVPTTLYLLASFRRARGPALTVALVGLGGAFLLTPHNWLPRYVLFILGLGAIGTAWVLHAGGAWTKRLVRVLLALGVAYTLWTAGPLGRTSPAQLEAAARLPAALRPTVGLSDVPAYRWLEENSYDGARVVYGLGLYWIAPLWESDLDNTVLYAESRILEFWHPEVVRLGANYVLVERHPYNDWIGSEGRLAPIYMDSRFAIYRVRAQEWIP